MENQPEVLYQLSYHILPFAYEKNFYIAKTAIEQRKVKNRNGKEVNCWKAYEFGGGQRLTAKSSRLISPSVMPETIGSGYILENAARKLFGLPDNPSDNIYCIYKTDKICSFRIKSLNLYLFETQTGFLGIEMGYDNGSLTADDIIDLNYLLKNIPQNMGNMYFRKRTGKESSLDVGFDMGELVLKVLEDVDVAHFFEGDKGLPKQSLVYSCVCLSGITEGDNWLKTRLYKMRRLFKDTYRPSPEEFDLIGNPEILQIFENSYWGVSLEGLANLIHLVDDHGTNTFFSGNYSGHIESVYLYFYLLALHQRYALLNFSILLSELGRVGGENQRERAEMIKKMKKTRLDVAFFNMRCIFNDISGITHQARLYDAMIKVLRVRELNLEIQAKLNGLAAILEIREKDYHAEKESAREKSREKLNILIAILTTIFAIISTYGCIWDISSRIASGGFQKNPPGLTCFLYIVALIMLTVSFTIILFLRKLILSGRK